MKNRKFHAANVGVKESASPREIRAAFRRQALQRHPDKRGGSAVAKEDFRSLLESYEFLLAHPFEEEPTKPTEAPPPRPTPRARGSRRDGRGGLVFLFVSLSLLQRAALVLLGLFTAGATTAVVVYYAPASAPSAAPVAASAPARAPLGVPPSALSFPPKKNEAEQAAAPPSTMFPERNCEFYPLFEGKVLPTPTSAKTVTHRDCTDLCDRWIWETEGEGGKCVWGTEVLAFREPSGTREAPKGGVGQAKAAEAAAAAAAAAAFAYKVPEYGAVSSVPDAPGSSPTFRNGPAGIAVTAASNEREPAAAAEPGADTGRAGAPGATPAAHSEDAQNKLMKAVLDNDIRAAKRALALGADVNATSSRSMGHTPLQVALLEGKKEIFMFLLENGADVNLSDDNGHTPLMFCALHRIDMEFVLALVSPGAADLDLVSGDGSTAAELAEAKGYGQMAAYLNSPQAIQDYLKAVDDKKHRKGRAGN